MTAADLIARLSTFDPDLEVCVSPITPEPTNPAHLWITLFYDEDFDIREVS